MPEWELSLRMTGSTSTWRYLAIAGLLVILIGAGLGVSMVLSHTPGVTKVNFDRG